MGGKKKYINIFGSFIESFKSFSCLWWNVTFSMSPLYFRNLQFCTLQFYNSSWGLFLIIRLHIKEIHSFDSFFLYRATRSIPKRKNNIVICVQNNNAWLYSSHLWDIGSQNLQWSILPWPRLILGHLPFVAFLVDSCCKVGGIGFKVVKYKNAVFAGNKRVK